MKFNNSNIPPGKKLIFRWSRTDPSTGQVIYARRRPFPILVDDTSSNPRFRKPVAPWSMTAGKPLKPQQPLKPLTPTGPLKPQQPLKPKRLSVQPTSLSVMKPVQAQPATLAPANVRYELRQDIQDAAGALSGMVRAGSHLPADQATAMSFAELLGGALGGLGGARASNMLLKTDSQSQALITHSFSEMHLPKSDEMVGQCRELANELGRKAEQHSGPGGDPWAQAALLLGQFCMNAAAGAINGASAGYQSNQVLAKPTDERVERFIKSF
ncbi:hypothetical protein [Corallococcus sp. CA054B]|uniref:hypothetical protein n=1 Tax=Corallococcus sp. CA054B TaxID=2316734 RepID=UPI0013154BAC|nr:hypothetical protein [Corallococcus sp. CA054B]